MDATRIVVAAALVFALIDCAAAAGPADAPPGALSCSGCHAATRAADTTVPRLNGRNPADIPVTQVLWANESTGVDGALWTDVHDPRMVAPGSPVAAAPSETKPRGMRATSKSRSIREIRHDIARQCAAAPGCTERAALAAGTRQREIELPAGKQPSRVDLMRAMDATAPEGEGKR